MPRLNFSRCAGGLIAGWLIAAIMFAVGASAATAGQTASGQDLGSPHDYMQTNPGPYVQEDPSAAYEIPFLGIAVQSETVGLEHGRVARGVEIVTVVPGSPAGAAGLQGSSPTTARSMVLFIGMVAGAALFPPAMLGVMALSKIGEPHQTIIAVDGERTRNVTEFEDAIEKADAGEVVYLTVVSRGRRKQIRVTLPIR
jgi:S1-C subfamily serine protease